MFFSGGALLRELKKGVLCANDCVAWLDFRIIYY